MRNLDFYEFAGILVPGILALVLLWCLYPSILPVAVTKDSPSAGAFGILVVIGYGAGHLVQALSNLMEPLFWRLFGGMPTDWLRKPKQTLISEEQARKLQHQANVFFADESEKLISSLSQKEWSAMVRQIYAGVQAAGRASRIDIFNGNYGMLRGLATALLIGTVALPASPLRSWPLALALSGALVLAALRMHRFATHYARELFVQFLVLPGATSIGANGIEVDMLSLGNADSILVTTWENNKPTRVLIGGGNKGSANKVRGFLRAWGVNYIDHVVCTHPHDDHAGGLLGLLSDQTLGVGCLWSHVPGRHIDLTSIGRALQQVSESTVTRVLRESILTQRSLLDIAQQRRIPISEPFEGASIGFMTVCGPHPEFYRDMLSCFSDLEQLRLYEERLGAMELRSAIDDVLEEEPGLLDEPVTQAENEASVILATKFNGDVLLFTGDAGVRALTRAANGYPLGACRWMQIPHHGSRRNITRELIEHFRPQTAYVSAEGNKKHPRRAVVNAFKTVGTSVYSTHYPTGGHLRFHLGVVPPRTGYNSATALWN